MLKVTILIDDNQKKEAEIEYSDVTIGELINELSIDRIKVGSVLVNGVPKRFTDKIEDGSRIYLLPILEGG